MKRARGSSGHFHAVRFYENRESLARIVAEFLGDGFRLGQPGLIIATPEHTGLICETLRARHFDLDALQRTRDLLLLDAREVLERFMLDGMPSAQMFNDALIPTIESAARGRTHRQVRAYGEMVDVLWQEAKYAAAIRLEVLWNQLASTHDFSLLCGYSMGCFYKDAAFEEICDQHTHVVAANGDTAPLAH